MNKIISTHPEKVKFILATCTNLTELNPKKEVSTETTPPAPLSLSISTTTELTSSQKRDIENFLKPKGAPWKRKWKNK